MKVLYVEGDPIDADTTRQAIARTSSEIPIELELVGTLSEARARLARGGGYELVLLCLSLPDGSGMELLSEIRESELAVAVVMLTSYGDEAAAVSALKAGADDYLPKRRGYLEHVAQRLAAARRRFLASAKARAQPLRVLYAEHSAADVDLTRRHLANHARQIQLEVVPSAEAALERLPLGPDETCEWDVLLLDLRLPGLTGLELLRVVRDERNLDLGVVLVTGSGGEDIAVRALRLGASNYLAKHPSYLFELPSALENAYYRVCLQREQRALRDSEAQLAAIVESAMDAIVSTNAAQRIVVFNAAAEAMFRCPRSQAIGQPLQRFLPARFREAHAEHMREFARTGHTSRVMGGFGRVLGVRSDGEEFPLEASIARTQLVGGVHLTAILHDVSQRRQSAAELREARERLEVAVRSANIGLWDWDLRTNRVQYSAEWKSQIGYGPDEIVDDFEEWRSRVHPEDLATTEARIAAYLADGTGLHVGEFRFRHKNGSYRTILAQGSLIRDETGVAVRMVGSHVDITERAELEAQLRHSQKVETVGRLASGVAHDFNNLLTIMAANAEFVMDGLAPDDPARAELEEIRAAVVQGGALTHQLLAFSRKEVLQPVVMELDEVVAGMESMLKRLIGEDIELALVAAAPGGHVRMDPGQLEQVVMNLVVNARDALPAGGKLGIETAEIVLDEARAHAAIELPAGRYLRLSVSDDGVGIAGPTRAHIFDPFFTTKEAGKGTGLGLSTVESIARQTGGGVRVESVVGEGSRFEVFLPWVAAETAENPSSSGPSAGAREVILVVEDERAIRDIAARALRGAGYEVLVTGSGAEALALLAARSGPVDLLLTDVIMPGMSGVELADRVVAQRPHVRVLYMSGYSSDKVPAAELVSRGRALLHKPFRPRDLARKVREILDAQR